MKNENEFRANFLMLVDQDRLACKLCFAFDDSKYPYQASLTQAVLNL